MAESDGSEINMTKVTNQKGELTAEQVLSLIAGYVAHQQAETETCPPVELTQDWIDGLSDEEAAFIDDFDERVQTITEDVLATHALRRDV